MLVSQASDVTQSFDVPPSNCDVTMVFASVFSFTHAIEPSVVFLIGSPTSTFVNAAVSTRVFPLDEASA